MVMAMVQIAYLDYALLVACLHHPLPPPSALRPFALGFSEAKG